MEDRSKMENPLEENPRMSPNYKHQRKEVYKLQAWSQGPSLAAEAGTSLRIWT